MSLGPWGPKALRKCTCWLDAYYPAPHPAEPRRDDDDSSASKRLCQLNTKRGRRAVPERSTVTVGDSSTGQGPGLGTSWARREIFAAARSAARSSTLKTPN